MLRAVQDLILTLAAGCAGVAVDAVEAVVLGDPGVVQGRLPRGGAVVLRAFDRSRVPLRARLRNVPRIAGMILDPGGDNHRSSRVRVLPGRGADHGVALLQLGGAIIVLTGFSRWRLVLGRQHVRQHRPPFPHLCTANTKAEIQYDRRGRRAMSR